MTHLASPPAVRVARPRWTDPRLALGLLLVVAAVVGVVAVVSAADRTTPVWVARVDLAAGTTLTADDLEVQRVSLATQGARYLTADVTPSRQVLTRPVGAGELVPAAAVQAVDSAERRLVTLAVERHRAPSDLARGDLVDVYLVRRDAGGGAVGEPELVLAAATVDAVDGGDARFGGSALERGVVLAVAPVEVPALVAATSQGTITLVRVPQGSP